MVPQPSSTRDVAATRGVAICVLGGFRVDALNSGKSLEVGPKTEALLTGLALAGERGLSRESLVESLWADADPQLARQSLNSLLHSVRQTLAQHLDGAAAVLHLGTFYRLNFQAGISVDVLQFEELSAAGDRYRREGDCAMAASAYAQAVDTYRGDLAGVNDVRGVVDRERLRSRYTQLLAWLADYYFVNDTPRIGLDYALKMLAVDPCREDAHRLAMRAYVRLGQRADALHQYRVCEHVVRQEYDAAPERATALLFEQVRRNPESV